MPSTLHPQPSLAALHYNSALSIWLSVDPLSDKYPGVSPYAYCGDNPVRLKDPDGRDIWEINEYGYSRCVEKSNTEHKIFFTKGKSENSFGKRVRVGNLGNRHDFCIENDNVDVFMNEFHSNENGGHILSYVGNEKTVELAQAILKAASVYTQVEWTYTGTTDNMQYISTSHNIGSDNSMSRQTLTLAKEKKLAFSIHTHHQYPFASDTDWQNIKQLDSPQTIYGIISNRKLYDFRGNIMNWPGIKKKQMP